MKRDIRKLTLAAETLMPTLSSPRHRAILNNYRKHAMLEVSGRYHEIFTPDLAVDQPIYRVAGIELNGRNAVLGLYKSLVDTKVNIMMLEHERIWVNDWGFASEALFHTYMSGHSALGNLPGRPEGVRAQYQKVVDDLDAIYVESRWLSMMWPYDEQCRMIGEHVYPAEHSVLVKCPPEEVITQKEVEDTLAPLIAATRIERFAV